MPEIQSPVDENSLERFLRMRCAALLSRPTYGRLGYVTQMWIGAALAGLGLLLFVVGATTNVPGLMGGASGPILGGIANLTVATVYKSRMKNKTLFELRMTSEARTFLGSLFRQVMGKSYEWYDPSAAQYQTAWNRSPGVRRGSVFLGVRQKTARELLPSTLFDVLDRTCYQYNRVCGMVELSGVPQTKRLARPAQLAADEALLEVMHQAATISRYPESAAVAVQAVEARIAALTELADRFESAQNRHPGLADKLSSSTAMETILEELKLEEMVRAELGINSSAEEPMQDRFRR